MPGSQNFPIRLTNLMKVPQDKESAMELLASLEKTLRELEEEKENPILVFKENMDNGYLYAAAIKDATNSLNVYAGLYQSAKELREIIEKKNW
jgi:tRNA(Ile2) C34 agmatinyltransferase TiaS